MTWTIKAENGESRSVESRAEAKSVKEDMEKLGSNNLSKGILHCLPAIRCEY